MYENRPYRALVKAKNSNGNVITKSGGSGYSSIFPDSWSQTRIMEEVEYAIRNNKGQRYPNAVNLQRNIYKGVSKDGTFDIDFVIVNDEILTFYPYID